MTDFSTVELFDPEGDVQQRRMGRYLLAYLDADSVQALAVHEELFRDPRGERVAFVALLMAMTAGFIELWEQSADREVIAEAIRASLAARALWDEGENDD